MVKGGSKLLGKGGQTNRDDCACYSTIHGLWPVDATPLALPGGGLEGVTPSTIRNKLK